MQKHTVEKAHSTGLGKTSNGATGGSHSKKLYKKSQGGQSPGWLPGYRMTKRATYCQPGRLNRTRDKYGGKKRVQRGDSGGAQETETT